MANMPGIGRIFSIGMLSCALACPASAAGCHPETFRLVLDVGHTPQASGARSARGVSEFVFNTKLIDAIAWALKDAGFRQVTIVTADGTGRDQLRKRTDKANRSAPDLYLSIHHDDTQKIFHKQWFFAGAVRNYTDHAAGYSLFVSTKNPSFQASLAFASSLGSALRDRGMIYSRHHEEDIAGERKALIDPQNGVYRYDDLHVLRRSLAPAVLLEAGVISNRAEELSLQSTETRQRIAQAITQAVKQFCGARHE